MTPPRDRTAGAAERSPSPPRGEVVIVGAAVVRAGRLLVQQRSYPAEVAGLWELPGGRVEQGESAGAAVGRECAEELGVAVLVGARVGPDVPLSEGKVLRVFAAALACSRDEPRPVEHRALRWVTAEELTDLDWLPADRALLPALRRLLDGTR